MTNVNEGETMTGADWTTATLAKAAGVTDSYIRYLLTNGLLRGEKFSRVWRIPYATGQQWIEERKEWKERRR